MNTYKQHLKDTNKMSMEDRINDEFNSLRSFNKEARKLVIKKFGFWKWRFMSFSRRSRMESKVSACLFYDDKIYWENIESWF